MYTTFLILIPYNISIEEQKNIVHFINSFKLYYIDEK